MPRFRVWPLLLGGVCGYALAAMLLACCSPSSSLPNAPSSRASRLVRAVLRTVLLCALLALPTASSVWALDEDQAAAGWSFSLGVFDLGKYQDAAEGGVEYRWRPLAPGFLQLKPTLGVSVTADGGHWAYAGVRWDVPVRSERWIPTIAFGVVAYEQGDGKDLGGVLQFRSAFDVAYRFDSGSRVGLALYHLSNASLHDFNPGSESLVVFWSLGR